MNRITQIGQPDKDSVLTIDFDLILLASGYESRSSHLASMLRSTANRKIAVGFQGHKDKGSRKKNDAEYERLGYSSIELSQEDSAGIRRLVFDEIDSLDSGAVRVLFDISSMTRAWQGGIIQALMCLERNDKIDSIFTYIPAVFSVVKDPYPPNEIVKPVPGFMALEPATKPTALIIGLGRDPGRALGIKEELDSDLTVTFFARPGTDRRYDEAVLSANKDVLEEIAPEFQFDYNLKDVVSTFSMMESLCRGLSRDYQIVLTSLGPKIFSLICFLISSMYSDISVWRISAGSRENVVDRRPGKSLIPMEVTWLCDPTSFNTKW